MATKAQRLIRDAEIVQLASERNEYGEFKYSYRDLAKMYNLVHPLISIICRKAGLPKRMPGTRLGTPKGQTNGARWYCPPSLKPMYDELVRKLESTKEARRIIMEHARIRGIES